MILDYRAFDTFGESTVLFVAVAGCCHVDETPAWHKKDEDGERLVGKESGN